MNKDFCSSSSCDVIVFLCGVFFSDSGQRSEKPGYSELLSELGTKTKVSFHIQYTGCCCLWRKIIPEVSVILPNVGA